MNFQEHYATYVLGLAPCPFLIEAAMEALEKGNDSTHLRILAGENPDHYNVFEVESQARKSLKELNLKIPEPIEAADILTRFWAGCIVDGNVSPQGGAREIVGIYEQASGFLPTEHYAGQALDIARLFDLNSLSYASPPDLYHALDPAGVVETAKQELDRAIRDEAERYLREHGV